MSYLSCLEQHPDGIVVLGLGRKVQRGVAGAVRDVDLGPVPEEGLQHAQVPEEGGQVHGGLAVVVGGVQVAVAALQELAHHHLQGNS